MVKTEKSNSFELHRNFSKSSSSSKVGLSMLSNYPLLLPYIIFPGFMYMIKPIALMVFWHMKNKGVILVLTWHRNKSKFSWFSVTGHEEYLPGCNLICWKSLFDHIELFKDRSLFDLYYYLSNLSRLFWSFPKIHCYFILRDFFWGGGEFCV